jgi:diguanylate cyclase (GGDEF)-like protein
MSSDTEKPPGGVPHKEAPHKTAPLSRVLDQSEQVQDKVKQAAADLSSVNAVLKDEIADGVPLAKVERALNQSEAIEVKVQEAAEELVAVNDALAEEINQRNRLEARLSRSDAALSESRDEERRSRHSALHDAVTGLPNLTLFNDRLRTAVAQAERHAWRLAVMFIDLDEFKSVNDAHGHDVGDRVLQMVGQRLQAVVRSGDTIGRRSGDEFLFLMLEAKDESSVAAFAVRVVESIAEVCEIDGVKLTVKASIGIALYPEDGRSAQELLKNADVAMYAAKQQKQGPALYSRIARP